MGYELSVDTQVTGSSGRFDPAKVVKHYSLQVKPGGNDRIRDGEFTQKTNSELLRVPKVGTAESSSSREPSRASEFPKFTSNSKQFPWRSML